MSDTPSKRGRKRLDGISAKEGQAPLIGVRLSSPIHAIVEDLATAKGVKPPVILREALDAYLGKGPPPALRAQVAVAVAGEGWGELASIVERERVSDVLAALGRCPCLRGWRGE